MWVRAYYHLKPLIPRRVQIALRRTMVCRKLKSCEQIWPIDEKAAKSPVGWSGWPDGKQFALVLTHDVDTERGRNKCLDLARLDRDMGFRSSFNFVARDYTVFPELRHELMNHGFEVGVHGLTHDGKLYNSRQTFTEQALQINEYLAKWNATGFRSPAMYHNLEWIHDLAIEYDASTFDTDPFEPQPDGMGTIFPFWVPRNGSSRGYVELPYTLPQDFTLFVLFQKKNIEIWERKLDWIVAHGGMALLITHPDYMNCKKGKCGMDEYPIDYYKQFLDYVKAKYEGQYWNALPKEISRFWKEKMVERGGKNAILKLDNQ